MNSIEDFLPKIKPHLIKNFLPLALGLLGFILLLYGLIGMVGSSSSSKDDIVFESSKEEGQKEEIVVDVSGEVLNPGVYKLSSNSRIKDALAKAGGLSGNADREWVEKNLNLAKKVQDGVKIYIPQTGESIKSIKGTKSIKGSEGESTTSSTGIMSTTGNTMGSISINSGSQAELEALPGIGPVTAVKIIENRPYGSIEELIERKIVGGSVFEKIKDKISY